MTAAQGYQAQAREPMRLIVLNGLLSAHVTEAADYHIGPAQALSKISDAPRETLLASDTVYIHWRKQADKETLIT